MFPILPRRVYCASTLIFLAFTQAAFAQSVDQLKTQARGLMKAGKYAQAAAVYEQALPIAERTNGKTAFATVVVMNELANAYESTGEYLKAAELYQRCVAAIESRNPNDENLGTLLNNLGVIHQNLSNFVKAEECFTRALAIGRRAYGTNSTENASELNNLANLYKEMGEYAKAEPLYLEAVRLYEAARSDKLPTGLTNVAGLYREMGQFEKAQLLYEKALKIRSERLGPNHPDVGNSLNSLGQLFRAKNDLVTAQSYLERALKVREAALGPDHLSVASTLNNLASVNDAQGHYAEAEAMYRRSLGIREKSLGPNHPDLSQIYNNLAGLSNRQNKSEQAVEYYQHAIELLEKQPKVNPGNVSLTVGNLASLQAEQRQWQQASDTYDKTRRLVRNYLSDLLPKLPEREQLAFLRVRDSHGFYAALSFGLLKRDDPAIAARSAEWLLNGKAVTFDALARRSTELQTAATTRWISLDAVRAAIPENAYLVDIVHLPIRNFSTPKTEEHWQPPHYVAWIIPPANRGQVQIIDLGPAQTMDLLVSNARKSITDSVATISDLGEDEAERKTRETLEPLTKQLFMPILAATQQSERLIISPDGALWVLPWTALPIAESSYAVEKHELRFVVSPRNLLQEASSLGTSQPVIFADPDYDLSPQQAVVLLAAVFRGPIPNLVQLAPLTKLPAVTRLEGTAAEAQAIRPKIAEFAGQEPILYEREYAQENIAKVVRRPKLLVVATHGFFLPQQNVSDDDSANATGSAMKAADGKPLENPLLRCGLMMAGCNQGQGNSDGVLTGLEITTTDLRGTKLVVLSACETGLGEIQNGEGVAGLRQSFHIAGAEAVMASFWSVDDRTTARTMTEMFHQLTMGASAADALRQAQIKTLESRRARYGGAHPFFWSAFSLTE